MWRYYPLLTDRSGVEVDNLKTRVAAGTLHPRQAKRDLAHSIVSAFHDPAAADYAAAEFDRVHARGELPSDLRVVVVDFGGEPTRALARTLVDAGLATSTSEAARKIQQGGVRVNGERVSDPRHRISSKDLPLTLQAGRLAVRLTTS
jgi:tyrosyl-tRNA synthetase